MTAPARLRVDFIACDGRGLCAEALPELITLDDWGFPIVSGQAVPPRLLADARTTVRLCPKLALRVDAGPSWMPPGEPHQQPHQSRGKGWGGPAHDRGPEPAQSGG